MESEARAQFRRLELRHWWFRGRRAVYLELLRAHLGRARVRRALDLGGGSGLFARELARVAEQVHVLDVDRGALLCAPEPGGRRLQADARQLPFADGSHDLVCLFDVLEHLDDEQAALREAWRVLRPGGLLVLSAPAGPWLFANNDRVAGHVRRYTRAALRLALLRARFRPERCTHANLLLLPAIAACVLALKALESLRLLGRDPRHTNLSLFCPPWLSALLFRAFRAELRLSARFDLPLGHSLLALARRPVGARVAAATAASPPAQGAGQRSAAA